MRSHHLLALRGGEERCLACYSSGQQVRFLYVALKDLSVVPRIRLFLQGVLGYCLRRGAGGELEQGGAQGTGDPGARKGALPPLQGQGPGRRMTLLLLLLRAPCSTMTTGIWKTLPRSWRTHPASLLGWREVSV